MAGIRALTPEQATKRARLEDTTRDKAVALLASFLKTFADVSSLAQQMVLEDGRVLGSSVSLRAAVESRATATLQKRSGTLRQFMTWFSTTGMPASAVFEEGVVFKYLLFLNDV